MTRNQALENGTGCPRQVSTARVALASDFHPEHQRRTQRTPIQPMITLWRWRKTKDNERSKDTDVNVGNHNPLYA
jgi:hypothetical protein